MTAHMTATTGGTSQYDNATRRAALAEYVVCGNVKRVSEILDIPRLTVTGWVKSSWGQELIQTIRHETCDELISSYTSLVKTALERGHTALERGDYVGVDSDGNDLYKPVKAKDAIVIAGIATDKMRLLSNQATSITANDSTLTKISEQLAAYAKDQAIKTIDASHTISLTDDVSD